MTTEVDVFKKALLALNINYDKIMKDKHAYDLKKDRYDELLKKETKTEDEQNFIDEFEEMEDPGVPIEVMYCREFLGSAENYCASVRPWYWLMTSIEYDRKDRLVDGNKPKNYRGFCFGYYAEDDMLYPYIVNGEYNKDYIRMGDEIYFNRPVHRLDYIAEHSKRILNKGTADEVKAYENDAPALYYAFIAARLAVEIAPFIAPDTTIEQRATQQFQLSLQALLKINEHAQRRRNPDPKEFVL